MNLDSYLEKLIAQQDEFQGIDVAKLKPGTLIEVHTRKSFYLFQVLDEPSCMIAHGGKYMPTPQQVYFVGSTFGGSMIKHGWIGFDMHMEIYLEENKKTINTTRVRKAKIVGEDWEYEMEWN